MSIAKAEKNYDFKKKLLTVHECDIRNLKRSKKDGEFFLSDNVKIKMSEDASEVVKTAVCDFADFLHHHCDVCAD